MGMLGDGKVAPRLDSRRDSSPTPSGKQSRSTNAGSLILELYQKVQASLIRRLYSPLAIASRIASASVARKTAGMHLVALVARAASRISD